MSDAKLICIKSLHAVQKSNDFKIFDILPEVIKILFPL